MVVVARRYLLALIGFCCVSFFFGVGDENLFRFFRHPHCIR